MGFIYTGFPSSSDGKESTYNAGDPGLIPRLRRSPGERNGFLLQYSCLDNSTDREAKWATVHGVTKSQTQLSNFHSFTNTDIKQFARMLFEKCWWDTEGKKFSNIKHTKIQKTLFNTITEIQHAPLMHTPKKTFLLNENIFQEGFR